VYEHMLVITMRESPFSKPMPKDVWLKVISAMDRCGKKAE